MLTMNIGKDEINYDVKLYKGFGLKELKMREKGVYFYIKST